MWLTCLHGLDNYKNIIVVHVEHAFLKPTTRGRDGPLNDPNSRPLGQISLIGDPSLLIGANCVVDVWTPGHVGKHVKQVCQLLWCQGTVLVLKHANVGLDHFTHPHQCSELSPWPKLPTDALPSFLISRLNLPSIPQDVKAPLRCLCLWFSLKRRGQDLTLSCLSKTLCRKR